MFDETRQLCCALYSMWEGERRKDTTEPGGRQHGRWTVAQSVLLIKNSEPNGCHVVMKEDTFASLFSRTPSSCLLDSGVRQLLGKYLKLILSL